MLVTYLWRPGVSSMRPACQLLARKRGKAQTLFPLRRNGNAQNIQVQPAGMPVGPVAFLQVIDTSIL
jgi:hypothetical protein